MEKISKKFEKLAKSTVKVRLQICVSSIHACMHLCSPSSKMRKGPMRGSELDPGRQN